MTESNAQILDRDFKLAASTEFRTLVSTTLQEIVNYGTQLLARARESTQDVDRRLQETENSGHHRSHGQDHLLPLYLLYYGVIETADAIEYGFSGSIATPLRPLVRVLFEALAQLEWMYQATPVTRAYAYLTFDLHQRIAAYKQFIPNSQQHIDMESDRSKDKWGKALPALQIADAKKKIDNLINLLQQPGYAEANREYEESNPKPRHWYAMYKGPRNFHSLSEHLDRAYEYRIIYKPFSRSIHNGDVAARVSIEQSINAMRSIAEMPMLASLTIACAMDATNLFGDFFRPGEHTQRIRWYKDKISRAWETIGETEIRTSP